LQYARLKLVKAQAEEKTALKYTNWVCKSNMRTKKYRQFLKVSSHKHDAQPLNAEAEAEAQ